MFRSVLRSASRYRSAAGSRAVAQCNRRAVISPLFKQTRFHSGNATKDNKNTLKVDQPQLMLAFTCNKCETRSSHSFSKQSYTSGTVLIQCPGCKNRHLIADNLKIFRDKNVNLEEILRAKGELVATTTEDLAFEDIPESLRGLLGHHAKDAPEEYQKKLDNRETGLPEGDKDSR